MRKICYILAILFGLTWQSLNAQNYESGVSKEYMYSLFVPDQARALAIDRTEGTHPIAQELKNLNHNYNTPKIHNSLCHS